MSKYSAGVLFGEELEALYKDAKANKFAMPAVNTIGTDSINATLETAAKVNSPVIIQFSNGGAQFIAGKGMPNDKMQANISGAISGALHIHNVAKHYGVPVILHTDHASHKWLPWISALIDAGQEFHKEKGRPLFSSHMLDLSEETIEDNIQTSVEYFKRMQPLGMGIEIELGVKPGFILFFDKNWAFETTVGIAGFSTRIEETTTNNDRENRQKIVESGIDLRLNILQLNLGIAYYF